MGRETAIALSGLTKTFGGIRAVDRLSLEVERGEIFGFLGPNGSGKTTTIRMLMGILRPSAGRVQIEGFDCTTERVEAARRTGYLPDNPVFHDYLRGREVVEFVAEMHGCSRDEARARARELTDELGLGRSAEAFAADYSTGMRKRLGLACALVHDPSVLVLDEPTNGLDPRGSRDVQGRIRAAAAAGKTVFLSTHLLEIAEQLCNRVGILDQGTLIALGPPAELRARAGTGGSLADAFLLLTEKAPGDAPDEAADA